MGLTLDGERNEQKYREIAKKFDEKCSALIDVFAKANEETHDAEGFLVRYVNYRDVLKEMLSIDKKYMLEMDEDELSFLVLMNLEYYESVYAGMNFSQVLDQHYEFEQERAEARKKCEEEIAAQEESREVEEACDETEKLMQEYEERYFEIVDKNAFENGTYELTEELKELLKKLHECYVPSVAVDAFSNVYGNIAEKVLDGGFTVGNPFYKKALAKHICILNMYLYDTFNQWRWGDCFPIEINDVLIFFYAWAYDKKDAEIRNALLKQLYRYLLETAKGFRITHDDLKSIHRIYESVLNGTIEFRGSKEDDRLNRRLAGNVYQYPKETLISRDAEKVYLIHDYVAGTSEPWKLQEEDVATFPSDPIVLLERMYELVFGLYEKFKDDMEKFADEIEDVKEHIQWEDCFANLYENDIEADGYAELAFQRDYEILRLYYEEQEKTHLLEEDIEFVKERIGAFLKAREVAEERLYKKSASSKARRFLFALQMVAAVLEYLLSEELQQGWNEEELETLYEDILDLCDDLRKKVYSRREAGAKEVIAAFTYERQRDLIQRGEELNAVVHDYADKLRETWENASLEELQNMKYENFKQLREEMPYLTKENLEETVHLYESFLQAKVKANASAEDLAFEEEIKKKCEKIWQEAMKKVEALYKQENKIFVPADIEPFYRSLFTAEYLFETYAKKHQNDADDMFDYSSIALEYYTAMEYFLNAVIYAPLKELYLPGTENNGYQGYMEDATHSKLTTGRRDNLRYNSECMFGNFGYLFANIHSAPALARFMEELRGAEFSGRGTDTRSRFKADIEQLGTRIAKQRDNIANRRNASAHGGTILSWDKAMAARAIVYDSSEIGNVQMMNNLKDTFDFILKILDIAV